MAHRRGDVMRVRLAGGAAALLVAAAGGVWYGRPADEPPDPAADLIRQLGDDDYDRREAATDALVGRGEAALYALRRAAATAASPEVRRRADRAARAVLRAVARSPSTELRLVPVEPGAFRMGSPAAEPGRRPDETRHPVRVNRLFLLGAFEVTQGEYAEVAGHNPSGFPGRPTPRHPVESVTWFDAVDFCNRLSHKDGFAPYYRLTDVRREGGRITAAGVAVAGGSGYRLPTEAEWEYACRAGTDTAYSFGRDTRRGLLNAKPLEVASGYGTALKWPDLGRPAPAGSYPPNPWGLYDLHGNVAEWCQDWYDRDYYAGAPEDAPAGPVGGTHRVLRGGSWLVTEGSCRSACRGLLAPGEGKNYAGFRVARTPGVQ